MKKMENFRSRLAITFGLISAVREGNLEKAREFINSYGLSHSKVWSGGYTLLLRALENKHTAVAKLLLANGSQVNVKTKDGVDTPLHLAVINGNIEIVKMILENGADVDAKNGRGRTPLHVAAEKGCLQIAEHLLDNGAYVNCVCEDPFSWEKNYTPLHFAVQKGHTEVITLLLTRGADVDVKGNNGITPLHIAAMNRFIHIAEDLLNHGAYIHSVTLEEGSTPLHFASARDDDEGVKLFLNRGADIYARTKDNLTPLHIATKLGHEKVVTRLLQHGAEVDNQDEDGETILHVAVEIGKLTIVEDVLKYCPDINNRRNRDSFTIVLHRDGEESEKICKALVEYGLIVNPQDANNAELFHCAVQRGYLNILKDLLKYGADIDAIDPLDNNSPSKKGFTPLHRAVCNKQEEVAKFLISHKADINAQYINGETPLLLAIQRADLKITKLLLANEANIKGCPELLNTAVKKECIEIIEALLQHGADINASDESGTTALYCTVKSRCTYVVTEENPDIDIEGKIAKLLLSKGANVNAQTKDGVTTLHAAAKNGHVAVVQALLEYDANVNCKDKNDNTPLHLSARRGNKKISIMLLDKGANVNAKQKDGITPLHLAAQEGHGNIVKVLLERGAKDSKIENGMTLLHLGARKGSSEIIKILFELGADIDSRDEDGRTALHIASRNGHDYVVQSLLDYGSDINITSKNNQTALDYAMAGKTSFYSRFDDYWEDNYSDGDPDDCPHNEVIRHLKYHIAQLKSANLYVSERNLQLMESGSPLLCVFQEKCEMEITRMKNMKISNSNFSFYDILAKDTNSLAMYMRNKKIVQILKSDDYKIEFPLYSRMIENDFRKGMKRRELLDQGNKISHILSNNLPDLPYDCVEKIISYLNNEDLRYLIDACKPLDISHPNNNINDLVIPSSSSQVQYVRVEEV